MPVGLLRAADERLDLREEAVDDEEIECKFEPNRWPRRQEQQLLDFSPDSLRWKVVEFDLPAEIPRGVAGACTRS